MNWTKQLISDVTLNPVFCSITAQTPKPTKAKPGFHVRPWCWIVERTFGWLNKNRRLSKDYEYLTDTSEALIHIAMIRIMARRLALGGKN